jgi:hypothetical protein
MKPLICFVLIAGAAYGAKKKDVEAASRPLDRYVSDAKARSLEAPGCAGRHRGRRDRAWQTRRGTCAPVRRTI